MGQQNSCKTFIGVHLYIAKIADTCSNYELKNPYVLYESITIATKAVVAIAIIISLVPASTDLD